MKKVSESYKIETSRNRPRKWAITLQREKKSLQGKISQKILKRSYSYQGGKNSSRIHYNFQHLHTECGWTLFCKTSTTRCKGRLIQLSNSEWIQFFLLTNRKAILTETKQAKGVSKLNYITGKSIGSSTDNSIQAQQNIFSHSPWEFP